MGINEKIEPCYAQQAKTLLKGAGSDGIKVQFLINQNIKPAL
jgi:hypothetical protein